MTAGLTDSQMTALVEYVRTLADGAPAWRRVGDVVKRVEREERDAVAKESRCCLTFVAISDFGSMSITFCHSAFALASCAGF